MGVFEMDAFAKGTLAVANMLADLTDQGCTTVIGGGDSGNACSRTPNAVPNPPPSPRI